MGASLINGLGGLAGFGDLYLPPNDDGSFAFDRPGVTDPRDVDLYDGSYGLDLRPIFGEQGLNFFGTFWTQIFINNNGNVTFQQSLSDFVPFPIGTGLEFPII